MSLTFSIITPVYNGSQYINKCIESVNKIEYDHNKIEHIIVDDGSTDNTRKICLKYAKKYKHIKFYSKSNGNWGSVINYVKKNKLVHNDYVVVCDADDVILPHAFKLINVKNENYDMIVGSFCLWDGKDKKILVHPYYFLFRRRLIKKRKMHYYSPLLLTHCTYIKKNIFYSVNDLTCGVSYQDTILMLQAFINSNNILYIRNKLSLYWKYRAGNTMSSVRSKANLKMFIKMLKYYENTKNITPFIYQVIGLKALQEYLKLHKIKFKFKKYNPDFTGFPWWVKPILWTYAYLKTKRYIKYTK